MKHCERNKYKGLANAKRPCDCRVLCLRLKSSLCSCAHSRRHSAVVTKVVTVCAQCSECQREEIQKARVNGGCIYDSLKPLPGQHHMLSK